MTDKRVIVIEKYKQDRLLHTLPVWARDRIAALEAECDAALSARESIEEFSHAKTDEILRLSADNELW